MRKRLFLVNLLALSLLPLGSLQAQPDGRRNDRGRDEQPQADRQDGRSAAARRAERGRGPQAQPQPRERPDRDRPAPAQPYRDRDRDNGRDYGRDNGRGDGRDNDHADWRGAGPNHDFRRGQRLPFNYRTRQYVIDDWRGHRLSAPPRGYHWVQVGSDYVLVAIATGIILQLLLSQ